MRTDLIVDFDESPKVKALGARWAPGRKRWYVPDGVDLTPFLQWVPGLGRLSDEIKRTLRRPT